MPDIHQLITDSLAGRAEAQRALYEHLSPYVLSVVRRYGVPEKDWPDVFQNTFLSVFQKLAYFDAERSTLTTWVTGFAINKCLAYQRKRYKFAEVDLAALDPNQFPDPGQVAALDDEYLIRLIAALPDGYRTVFNLYVIDGFSHREIARRLGITESSSRSQFARARKILRNRVTDLKAALYVFL